MLGAVDHVGFLARDLEGTIARFSEIFGVQIARHIDRPQFSLIGCYLGEPATVEVFSFTDEDLLEERLAGADVIFDHVAHVVDDIDAMVLEMGARGVRFAGPDLREELTEPVLLDGVRHLWTIPETACGHMLQLISH